MLIMCAWIVYVTLHGLILGVFHAIMEFPCPGVIIIITQRNAFVLRAGRQSFSSNPLPELKSAVECGEQQSCVVKCSVGQRCKNVIGICDLKFTQCFKQLQASSTASLFSFQFVDLQLSFCSGHALQGFLGLVVSINK